jgi:CRISPR-associated protein Cmr1
MLSDISCQKNNFEAVLNEVGTKQQLYRSYGSGGKVNGQKALQLFKDDHDAIYDIAEGRFTMHPKRLVFGAPHNYFLSSGSKVNVEVTVAATNKNRRASPLFVHVHKFGEQYYAIQTLLPAQFSFENSAVEYKIKKKSPIKKTLSEKDIDWSVITDYLTLKEYKGHNESSEGFVNREAIFAGDKR